MFSGDIEEQQRDVMGKVKMKLSMIYCFEKAHGFPQSLGAVDETHVNIKTFKNNSTDFINRKGHHSINVQACINYNYCFFDVVMK